ncbi:unnamed protein product [Pseudo-nitzschia multistriata]|uniref:Cation/H+ exchanger domain-containing protein n=1 Tax=Pseudo-nitzschia multistriata TaxID=183589 RepID=A0A448ZKX2_9STRA|nr:unnamed protein product [Pseudo-nitzschia multistriata]
MLSYPITVRIGLRTNWQETAFQIYGGLRGAVGIALSIALDNQVLEYGNAQDLSEERRSVKQLYAMVGGIAFLTLLINGSTAGPLLKKLGLADSTEERGKIIEAYKVRLRSEQIDNCVKLLTFKMFKSVDFQFIQDHMPYLRDLTIEQLAEAVESLKDSTPSSKYSPPHLENVLSVLKRQDRDANVEAHTILTEDSARFLRMQRIESRKKGRKGVCRSSMHHMMTGDPLSAKELRLLFISMLQAQYEKLIDEGFLTSQHGLTIAFEQSLEMAESDVNKGGALNDLTHLTEFYTIALNCTRVAFKATAWLRRDKISSFNDFELHHFILLELAFVTAHERAQDFFQQELGDSDAQLSEAGKIVIRESKRQVSKVEEDLNSPELTKFVIEVATYKVCDVLLSQSIHGVERLVRYGLLKESEAEHMIEEMIRVQKEVRRGKCNMNAHASKRHVSILDVNRETRRNSFLGGTGKKKPPATVAENARMASVSADLDGLMESNSIHLEEA